MCVSCICFDVTLVCSVPISSNPREYRVVAGEYNLDRNEGTEQFMGVEKIIIHPGWTGNLGIGYSIKQRKYFFN